MILCLLCCMPLFGQTADNVLVILNEASSTSMDIGMYYARKRGISKSNLLRLKTTTDENISREDFDRQIHDPIGVWLTRTSAQDRILYIVLTKGIPIRITGTSGQNGNTAGIHPDTIKLILQAETRLAKDDRNGARRALEEATARDGTIASAQLLLAELYESDGDYDKAIERYRTLQQMALAAPMVLNNLAYALAVRKNNVQEALPLAEKAHELVKGNASISDTLGWIYHLAGQDLKAVKILEEAARTAPGNAEIHLHFAIVSAASGNKQAAESALKRALEINPKLGQSEEVKLLRATMEP